jgi:hypothetical protein
VLKPFAVDIANEKEFLQDFADNFKPDEREILTWNSNMKMVAKSGAVYVLKGEAGLFYPISQADNYKWCNRGGKESLRWSYRLYLGMVKVSESSKKVATSDKQFASAFQKRITYIPRLAIYLVQYSGDVEKWPLVEKLSDVNIKSVSAGIKTSHSSLFILKRKKLKRSIPNVDGFLIKTGTEVTTKKEDSNASKYNVKPLQKNLKSANVSFLCECTNNVTQELEVFSPNMTIEPTEGNLYMFTGQWNEFAQVRNADQNTWRNQGSKRMSWFYAAYLHQTNSSKEFRKRIIYNYERSIFIVYYYKVTTPDNPGVQQMNDNGVEENNYDIKLFKPLESENESMSSQTITPHMTNTWIVDRATLRIIKNSDKDTLQKWIPNTKLDSKTGNLYVFSGTKENFEDIVNADNYLWHRQGICNKGGFKNYNFYAKFHDLTPEERTKLGLKKLPSSKKAKISIKKRISFNVKTSVYLVHYLGKLIDLPFLKRQPSSDLPVEDTFQTSVKLQDENNAQESSKLVESLLDFSTLPALESRKTQAHQGLSTRKRCRSENQAALETMDFGDLQNKRLASKKATHEL